VKVCEESNIASAMSLIFQIHQMNNVGSYAAYYAKICDFV